MLNEYLKSIWLVLPITLVTIGLEAVAMPRMPKTGSSSLPGTLVGFLIFGLGFGFLAILAYYWVNSRWPANSAQVYLGLALILAVLFTLLGVVMHFAIKSPWLVVVIWTMMNFLWGIGYGWFLPRILSA